MKKNRRSKLKLSRAVIRRLNGTELTQVVGAAEGVISRIVKDCATYNDLAKVDMADR